MSARKGELIRYSFVERMCHWTNAIAYVYCLATGLAFFTPYLFWIAIVLGGGPTSRFWHPILGLVFVAAEAWMHALWGREMKITGSDKEWLRKVKFYATNREQEMPLTGRYNAGQKLYYWLIYYGAMLLLVTGLVMWFPEYVPFKAGWIRPLMTILHCCGALLTIGGFIIHVYMSVWLVPGSLGAMTFGTVSRAWAWTHHRLWYQERTGEAAPRE